DDRVARCSRIHSGLSRLATYRRDARGGGATIACARQREKGRSHPTVALDSVAASHYIPRPSGQGKAAQFKRFSGMDSLELNKVVGEVLVGGMVALVSGILAEKLVEPRHIGGGEVATAGGQAPAPQAPAAAVLEPVSPVLASADAKAGEAVFKKCAT